MHHLIIDDNESAALELEKALRTLPRTFSVTVVSTEVAVTNILSTHLVDTVFVRIRLFDFRWLDKIKIQPALVLIVSRQANGKVDYYSDNDHLLIEPFSITQVRSCLKKIAQVWKYPQPDFLFVRNGKRWVKIPFDQIEMVEKKEQYAEVFTSAGSILFRGSVGKFRQRLPMDRFIRISDTLIIPASEMAGIKENRYTYKGREIPLTFEFSKEARQEMDKNKSYG